MLGVVDDFAVLVRMRLRCRCKTARIYFLEFPVGHDDSRSQERIIGSQGGGNLGVNLSAAAGSPVLLGNGASAAHNRRQSHAL